MLPEDMDKKQKLKEGIHEVQNLFKEKIDVSLSKYAEVQEHRCQQSALRWILDSSPTCPNGLCFVPTCQN
ncbi:putative salivary gland protein 6 [Frankliniella occidentalis]|nr:putative salivary gland protein 6 [Frankliniella occidentalis]